MIRSLPEDPARLGQCLIECGALTAERTGRGAAGLAGRRPLPPSMSGTPAAVPQASPDERADGTSSGQRRRAEHGAQSGRRPVPARERRQARRTDQPGRRAGHRQRRREPVRPAVGRRRPARGHRHHEPAGRGGARWRADPAHGADRRNLQPLQSRRARSGAGTGQGRRAGDQRRRDRARQVDGGKAQRPADAPGAQCARPRHRIAVASACCAASRLAASCSSTPITRPAAS